MIRVYLFQVVANQEGIQMSGYLKCKKGRHGWKKSWFVLKDNVLYSYKASSVSHRFMHYNYRLLILDFSLQREFDHKITLFKCQVSTTIAEDSEYKTCNGFACG